VHFESVPQVLLGFYWFATQLSRRKEFKMASLATRQKWRLAPVFKNQHSFFNHDCRQVLRCGDAEREILVNGEKSGVR
jgi:hypothetical protein